MHSLFCQSADAWLSGYLVYFDGLLRVTRTTLSVRALRVIKPRGGSRCRSRFCFSDWIYEVLRTLGMQLRSNLVTVETNTSPKSFVAREGVEPPTLRSSGERSTRLSYLAIPRGGTALLGDYGC